MQRGDNVKRIRSLLRLSTKGQTAKQTALLNSVIGHEELDIPGQRNEIATYLLSKPEWELSGEYAEKGVSAFRKGAKNRDVLQEALRAAEEGEFDVLVVWKMDRLSRRMEELPAVVRQLDDAGVEVWSVVDAPGGKHWTVRSAIEMLMLAIQGFRAQSESEDISLRTSTYKRQYAAEGHWNGGKVPYGYKFEIATGDQGDTSTHVAGLCAC